ncbi:helix-turn-helix domain-containing protein [Cytophagaceae bacterium YF14B1]|uniref:Helix-turn-helix domain-containing protein n=1 Tax=Xanthocytophaga flava TaxID=3048013 RepID=A0AAE3QVE2_9BACT|nr:helix-turn-helix domain-containing protein [Xanthocytophaga flavus]MDJ1486142.1 helix-turn-helix domain-containing protein [Xanthocytophaga flavus]
MLNLSLLSLIILLGSIQGSILTLVLFLSKEKGPVRQKYLAWFTLILAYNSIQVFLYTTESPLVIYCPNTFFPVFHIFCLGPLLLLYVVSNTIGVSNFPYSVWKYFIPSIISFLINVIHALLFFTKAFGPSTPQMLWPVFSRILQTEHIILILTFAWFWFQSYSILERWNKINQQDKENPETTNPIIYIWLKRLLFALLTSYGIWAITIFATILFDLTVNLAFPLEISLALLVYWIAFVGNQKIQILQIQKEKINSSILDVLGPSEINTLINKMQQVMEQQKCYLDPELNLSRFAQVTELNSRYISAICNQVLKLGFGEFVNQYRIREAKTRLSDPQYQHLTIAGIALESGFNSIQTFQRVFKQTEGITPREFQNSQPKTLLKT